MSVRAKYTTHFSKCNIQMLKITDTESYCYCIERGICKRQRCAIFAGERYLIRETCLLYLFTAYFHHAFRNVSTNEKLWL